MLLEGLLNSIGVKAFDKHGNGVQIQGEIIDGGGRQVTAFTSSYKGMGSINLLPRKGETYTVRVPWYPDYSYTFNDIIKEGIKFEFEWECSNE